MPNFKDRIRQHRIGDIVDMIISGKAELETTAGDVEEAHVKVLLAEPITRGNKPVSEATDMDMIAKAGFDFEAYIGLQMKKDHDVPYDPANGVPLDTKALKQHRTQIQDHLVSRLKTSSFPVIIAERNKGASYSEEDVTKASEKLQPELQRSRKKNLKNLRRKTEGMLEGKMALYRATFSLMGFVGKGREIGDYDPTEQANMAVAAIRELANVDPRQAASAYKRSQQRDADATITLTDEEERNATLYTRLRTYAGSIFDLKDPTVEVICDMQANGKKGLEEVLEELGQMELDDDLDAQHFQELSAFSMKMLFAYDRIRVNPLAFIEQDSRRLLFKIPFGDKEFEIPTKLRGEINDEMKALFSLTVLGSKLADVFQQAALVQDPERQDDYRLEAVELAAKVIETAFHLSDDNVKNCPIGNGYNLGEALVQGIRYTGLSVDDMAKEGIPDHPELYTISIMAKKLLEYDYGRRSAKNADWYSMITYGRATPKRDMRGKLIDPEWIPHMVLGNMYQDNTSYDEHAVTTWIAITQSVIPRGTVSMDTILSSQKAGRVKDKYWRSLAPEKRKEPMLLSLGPVAVFRDKKLLMDRAWSPLSIVGWQYGLELIPQRADVDGSGLETAAMVYKPAVVQVTRTDFENRQNMFHPTYEGNDLTGGLMRHVISLSTGDVISDGYHFPTLRGANRSVALAKPPTWYNDERTFEALMYLPEQMQRVLMSDNNMLEIGRLLYHDAQQVGQFVTPGAMGRVSALDPFKHCVAGMVWPFEEIQRQAQGQGKKGK